MELNPSFHTVASGLIFPEGPVALSDGSLLFVELGSGRLNRLNVAGEVSVVADLGGSPNGAAVGPDGSIYICNSGGSYACAMVDGRLELTLDPSRYSGGSIQKVDLASGRFETLYDGFPGGVLQAPNDLVFDRGGGLWFTDFGRSTEDQLYYGGIFYAKADGSEIRRVRQGQISPNGIGLSPDEQWLYWADSYTGRLWRCAIEAPGTLSGVTLPLPGEVVTTLPGYQLLDSLAVAADGSICVATMVNGGITVFDEGGVRHHVALDDGHVTNICFSGDDMRTVWITAASTGSIFKGRWPAPGLRLNFNL